MRFLPILCFLIFYCLQLLSQVPENRIVNWSNAGLNYSINEDIETVNISDYGAIVDDGLSDNQAIVDAMAYFDGQPGKILFDVGVYNFNSRIILQSGIVLEGAGSDQTFFNANLDSEQDFIYASGSISSTTHNVTFAKRGSAYIILQSALTELSPGDIIKLQMDGEPFMTSDWAYQTMGQIVQIESIVEDTLFLTNTLRHNFDAENNPFVVKVNPVHDVLIKSLKISRLDQTTAQTNNILFNYAFNCCVRDVESENCNFAHISLRSSSNCEISGCYIHHAHAYGEGGQGYGAEISATSGDNLIHNNIYEHLRHSVLLQSAANGNVIAYNYSFDPYWDQGIFPSASAGDLVLHGNYAYCNLFEGNIAQNAVIDDSHGKNGPYNTFFRNRLEKYGIVMNFNPATDTCNFIGNEITNTGFLLGNYSISGNGHYEYGNNKTGTCTPSGTTNLLENSFFLEFAPCYFYDGFEWPLIGYPVLYNEFINPAYARYYEGQMTFDTCETATIFNSGLSDNRDVMIYPNPNTGSFVIEDCEGCDLKIYNSSGVLLFEKNKTNSKMVNTNLDAGIYLVEIKTENDMYYRKLVVNKD
ncbi:MAG: T9SS type A sorting domain-containing protein [Bacteroidales bacterium]|nr:T9SS type A sorting domain-containing protein [Bacteroidales bacterium]